MKHTVASPHPNPLPAIPGEGTEPLPAGASDADASHSLHRHARLIGGLTLVSRVLGLAREVVAGHYLGTGLVASAFTVAFTIPNLFRKLLGEGALSQAFIPLYAQAIQRETVREPIPMSSTPTLVGLDSSVEEPAPAAVGAKDVAHSEEEPSHSTILDYLASPPSAEAFAAGSVKLLTLILLALTIVGELVLGVCLLLADPNRPDRRLMLEFALVMLPYVLLVCGGAFLSAILQVHKRFGPPAFAPVLLNVVHIGVVFGGAAWLGLHGRQPVTPTVIALQTKLAFLLAVGVLVAGAMQVAVLLPALREIGFRFRWDVPAWTPQTKKMLLLSLPVAMGAAVLQVSVLLDKAISYTLMQGADDNGRLLTTFHALGHVVRYPMELGATRRLDLAQLMYQFPLGIFAIAIATAIFPALSASAADEDRTAFKRHCRQGVLATLWEGIPASVGLILVADPAVRLLFQHGQITPHDAGLIARSTMVYAGGIWAYSMLQVVNRAYYALHDTLTPLVASVVNIVANLIVELPLLWWLGEPAMAVGTLVSFAIQAVVMLWLLDRRVNGLGAIELLRPTLKIILATLVMLGVCLLVRRLPIYPHGDTRAVWLAQLLLLSGVGGAVYLALCRGLGLRTFGR